MPHTFWTFIVGSLALAGFPFTAGFFSKDEILIAADIWADGGFLTGSLVYWVGLAAAFVTTFYMSRAIFLIFAGENRSHHAPHESGKLMVGPLMLLAVLSIASGYLLSPFSPEQPNFETWTATPILTKDAIYPFTGDGAAEALAGVVAGDGLLAAGAPPGAAPGSAGADTVGAGGPIEAAGATTAPLAAASEDGSVKILHGVPTWHPDLLAMVLVLFFSAVFLAYRFYGKGLPERDPTMSMGRFTDILVAKYGFDDAGYKYVVVPVRDKLSAWASYSSNVLIDGAVAGVGRATKQAAMATYRVVGQQVIDGGVNGAAFSAAWWSEKLKRIQSGDVQRYAGVLVAGTIVLVLAFAAAR
jgi:NADH-quinone oxidoreductase subunit L